jgi:hypothetical protein
MSAPETETKLAELQAPAFYYDDQGLEVFDEFEESFAKALEEGNDVALAFIVNDYAIHLLSLAEELNWFEDSDKQKAIDVTKKLAKRQ